MRSRNLLLVAAATQALAELTAEEKLSEIRARMREPRKPSGKDRSKIKAARKQRKAAR